MKGKKPFDHYKEHICKVWFDEKGYQTATEIVSGLIRCKDCKHHHGTDCEVWDYRKTEDDKWCAWAERKEE